MLNVGFSRSPVCATPHIAGEVAEVPQTSIFAGDLADSRVVSYAQWKERPLREKVGERIASMIGSQL